MSLHGFLHDRGMEMPGFTTMVENVNLMGQETLEFILGQQIDLILDEGLDDFRQSTIDSTAAKADRSRV